MTSDTNNQTLLPGAQRLSDAAPSQEGLLSFKDKP